MNKKLEVLALVDEWYKAFLIFNECNICNICAEYISQAQQISLNNCCRNMICEKCIVKHMKNPIKYEPHQCPYCRKEIQELKKSGKYLGHNFILISIDGTFLKIPIVNRSKVLAPSNIQLRKHTTSSISSRSSRHNTSEKVATIVLKGLDSNAEVCKMLLFKEEDPMFEKFNALLSPK